MNVIGITGNLTDTPEVKMTPSGDAVCSFTVAVKRPHTQDKTDFIDCVAWKKKAEFVGKYFVKGQKIEVSGYLTTRIFEVQGGKRKATEIVCEDICFGGKKEDNSKTTVTSEESEDVLSEEGVPF